MNDLVNIPENKSKLDWYAMRQLKTEPKLSQICSDAKHLFGSYYQIGDTDYAYASFQWNSDFTEEAVYILAFIWAPSAAVFNRIRSRDMAVIAADDGIIQPMPEGLKVVANADDYSAIANFCSANKNARHNLIDLYDHKMERLGSCFSVGRLHYYFRSSMPVPSNEPPCGVKLSTRDLLGTG